MACLEDTVHRAISHAKILLNRLKQEEEQIIEEEQTGYRAGRSSTEQIFNLRIINNSCTIVIENLHVKTPSAVHFIGITGDRFITSVGVRQECLQSPTLFNIFLERIMTETLENHEATASLGGRTITNLHFAVY